MIRVVAFDFDGTLVDSNGVKEGCMRKVVAGFEQGAEALRAALALGGDRYRVFAEVARRLDADGAAATVAARGRALAATYTECCARAIMAAPERRGGRDVLAALRRRGVRVWIASATPARDLAPILRQRGLMPLLHGALGGPASKVDNLRRIMQVERAAPGEFLFVGDSPEDHAAAAALGTWFVAITAENRIAGSHRFAMRDLTNLVPLVARLRSRPQRVSA
jgi:phosphoglycolate phosphatase-like HAD superfamily hydrolase